MKKIVHFLYLISFSLLFFTGCNNLKPNFIENISFYKDTTNTIQINQINQVHFKNLKNSDLGFNSATFWFKITLHDTKFNQPIFFDIKESSIKKITLFDAQNRISTINNTTSNPTLSLEITNPSKKTYYLKTTFNKQVYFNLRVKTKTVFYKDLNFTYLKYGWYYGLVFMVILINIFFYSSLKDPVFLWYCFFLASINLGISTYDGALNLIVNTATLLKFTIGTIYFLIPLSCAIFASIFLRINLYWPKIKHVAFILLLGQSILTSIYFITSDFKFIAFGDIIALIIFLSSWILGVLLLKKESFARFYVLGYSIILFTAILYTLSVNFGIQFFTVTLDHMKIGTLIEMFVLTFAITYRVKKIHQEHIKIKNELQFFINQTDDLQDELSDNLNKNESINLKIKKLAKEFNLAEREIEILLLIANGNSNKEIAESLFISINTVKYHTKNLYEKLAIKKRSEITTKLI